MLKFSLLISVYAKEKSCYLYEALQSLIQQSTPPNEIILVKDGPLTEELDNVIATFAKEYDTLKIVPLKKNVGLGEALNKGLKECSYDIVARMDSDDISKQNRFEKQLTVFKDNPNIDIVSAWIDEFQGKTENIISIRKLPKEHKEIYSFAKFRSPINHPVVMFKKSAVMAAGGYKHFPLFEDYYLWVRMLINKSIFYNIQESLLYFRTSKDMYKRRGGLEYAITEFKLQKEFYKIGFIPFSIFIRNIIIRLTGRILPNLFRSKLYKLVLRK